MIQKFAPPAPNPGHYKTDIHVLGCRLGKKDWGKQRELQTLSCLDFSTPALAVMILN
jgi:hypothetical protein